MLNRTENVCVFRLNAHWSCLNSEQWSVCVYVRADRGKNPRDRTFDTVWKLRTSVRLLIATACNHFSMSVWHLSPWSWCAFLIYVYFVLLRCIVPRTDWDLLHSQTSTSQLLYWGHGRTGNPCDCWNKRSFYRLCLSIDQYWIIYMAAATCALIGKTLCNAQTENIFVQHTHPRITINHINWQLLTFVTLTSMARPTFAANAAVYNNYI